MELQIAVSAATLFALIGATWKVSAELATMQARMQEMADKIDVALLKVQLATVEKDINELWKAIREHPAECPVAVNALKNRSTKGDGK